MTGAPGTVEQGGPQPPTSARYALFETALGWCAIAWTEAGISGVQLPGASPRQTLARLGAGGEAGSPADERVRPVVEAIVGLLAGVGDPDRVLAGAVLDRTGVPAFNQRVYQVTQAIPAGSTLSYGEVADRIGVPGAARAVGRALGDNPYPIVVPCHRVLAADGSMHGFSAPGGLETKRRMLQIEGALPPTLF
ncbi:MAG TPA: methylated-DNA--[protein]-cysteine S-methyltransferase [Jatrophihabitans sp.]|jgi:methylated-DNA-[protein]-cysteine S-methyltransferase|nr:methylated-DNA--[protein]-cysteine S-methyltransferase [Jatrophihabitans sp.]